MKLAIVVGHNSQSQGAVRSDTGESEYVWNGRLAQRLHELGEDYGLDVKVFHRTPVGSYTREIEAVYDDVDDWNASASIELHFNGSASDASGTETLTSGTALSMMLAEDVQREMVISLGLRDRGIITRRDSGRGYKSLVSGRSPAILIEPFFGSSGKGTAATDSKEERESLANAILRGSSIAMARFPRSTLDGSRTIKSTTKQRAATSIGAIAATGGAIMNAITESPMETLQAVRQAQEWQQYIPIGTTLLAVIAVGAFIYTRMQSDNIVSARVDDHDRGIR